MVNVIGRRIDIQPAGGSSAGGGTDLGSLFSQLGKQLFGDTLTPEVKRRQAEHIGLQNEKAAREIDFTALLSKSAGNPDAPLSDILSNGIMAGTSASQLGDLLRVRAANVYGASDPRTTNAYIGAGGAYGGTVAGAREGEATKINLADLTSKRQADGQVRVAGLTPVEAVDPSGAPVWTTRADVANGTAGGRGLAPFQSTDQVIGSEMSRLLRQAGNQPGQPGATSAQAGAPAEGPPVDPLQNLPASIQKKAGLLIEPKSFINPKTNTVATSFDGGKWGVTDSGDWMPLRSGAWVPTGPESAVSESRLALMKAHAAAGNPNLVERDPLTGQVAQSAYKATGVDAFGQEHVNSLLGSLGITRLFGTGEVGPDYERARSNLEVFRQTTKNAFMNSPTSPIKEQAAIDRMMPGPALFANPESEARKVGTMHAYLVEDNKRLRETIVQAIDPAAANRAQQALVDNEKALGMLTRGASPAAGQPRAQPGSPSPAPRQPGPPAAATPPPSPAQGVTHVWTPDAGVREVGR